MSPWRRRFASLTAASTLVLVFVGGLVTSTESGLAVPDWPLSYGMLMPPLVGGILYEHGHRMVAASVGFLTLVVAVWTAFAETRAWVRRLAWTALAVVVAQGILGGLTVIFLLPTPVSVTHACLAQAFFCIVIALAYVHSLEWLAGSSGEDVHGVRAAAVLAASVVYGQLALGAVMRHTGAGLAIPDFPLAFGGLLPPLTSSSVAIHFAHRVGAILVALAVLRLLVRCERTGDRRLTLNARILFLLVLAQIGLGGAAVLTAKSVLLTTAHVATGAAVLGGCVLLALRAHRRLRAPHCTEALGVLAGQPSRP